MAKGTDMSPASAPLDQEVMHLLAEVGRKRIRDLSAQVDRTQEFSHELWDLICEIGLPSLPFPEVAGGGGSFRAYVDGIEEVASHGAVAALYSGPTVQVASAIARFGTDGQLDQWGRGLMS